MIASSTLCRRVGSRRRQALWGRRSDGHRVGCAARVRLASARRVSKDSRGAPNWNRIAVSVGADRSDAGFDISEMLDRLLAERDIKASRALLWTFLDRCGLTFKKRPRVRASRIART